MACKAQAILKGQGPSKTVREEDARSKRIPIINLESDDEVNNGSGNQFSSFQAGQNSNGRTFYLNLDKECSYPSIHGGISLPSGPMAKSDLTTAEEPPMKKLKMLSVDLQRKFLYAVETLGGPLVATPKKILDLMHGTDLTEDEIKSHLLNFRLIRGGEASGYFSLPPPRNIFLGLTLDVDERLSVQSRSGWVMANTGESLTGRMAAAAEMKTNDGGRESACEPK